MRNFIALHEPIYEYVYPINRTTVVFRIKAEKNKIEQCRIIYWNRNKSSKEHAFQSDLHILSSCHSFDYWEVVVDFKEIACYINYYFVLISQSRPFYLNYYKVSAKEPQKDFFFYTYTSSGDIFTPPGWTKNAIVYQIFPDRFYIGDSKNNPPGISKWGIKPDKDTIMGGDIKGIIKKIGYLNNIGINTIYINPVFLSGSSHGYDTKDYYRVAPRLGTKNDLKKMVVECHKNKIKVILDGVFNHCGFLFQPFQDVLRKGAKSRYANWFYISDYPLISDNPKNETTLNYETIGYFKDMPKLNYGSEEVRRYVLGIALYWTKELELDGWRLDVSDEVEYTFWQEFRRLIKRVNSECVLIGEAWTEKRGMVRGDQMDSLINYMFKDILTAFVAKKEFDIHEFDMRIGKMLGIYSNTAILNMFNIIGSHDTKRFLTECSGDIRRMKVAVAIQMLFPGIPVIYYGDEVGMEGFEDPDCRRAMEWEDKNIDTSLLQYYKKLIAYRKSNPILINGSFERIFCSSSSNCYGFAREYKNKRIYVLISFSETDKEISLVIPDESKTDFTDILGDKNFLLNEEYCSDHSVLNIKISPYQVIILDNNITQPLLNDVLH